MSTDGASLAESNVARGSFGLMLLAASVVVGTLAFGKYGPTAQERFLRYLGFYMRRHAEWTGVDDDPASMLYKLLAAVVADHSLLRLVFPADWSPIAPTPLSRRLLVLLALVQANGAVGMLFLVAPVRGALGVDNGLLALIAALACVCVHVLLRSGLEALHTRRALVLFRRPDERGATEGHVLARAAIAHFDTTHTLRHVLRSWRQIAWELDRLEHVFQRLAFAKVLRHWRLVSGELEVKAAASRLRAQKLQAWALLEPQWLHAWSADVALRLRPLAAQLRLSMPLHDGLIDALAVATHANLEPSASERMLERPAVARARLLLGARWALATWTSALRLMARRLEQRRAERTALGARRTAAAARRAAAVLGTAWGMRAWREAIELLRQHEEAQLRIAASMSAFGGQRAMSEGTTETDRSSEADDDEAGRGGGGGGGEGEVRRLGHSGALASAVIKRRKSATSASGGSVSGRETPSPAGSRVSRASSRLGGAGSPSVLGGSVHGGSRVGDAAADSEGGGDEVEGEGEGGAPPRAAWRGVSALDPESLFDDPMRLEALRQQAMAAHPDPPARSTVMRPMTSLMPHPVRETCTSALGRLIHR